MGGKAYELVLRRRPLRYLACASLAIATQHAAPDVALAGARIGIVLLHGALATPGELDDMAKALTDTGYVVEAPEMCWSRERHYDKTFLECLAEIGPAVAAVKAKGAAAVVVAGFAFGGSAAIAYGARHGGLAGIAALAPDHEPDRLVGEAHIAKSLALVIRLNEAGKGNQPMDLAVYVNGKVTAVRMTARFYPTFFAVNSPGSMPANTPKLTAPLLWVAGVKDKSQLGPAYAFAKAPANPLNRYVKLASDHAGTLAGGKDTLLSWLSDLAAALH
jgi:dienelactone hydrolase